MEKKPPLQKVSTAIMVPPRPPPPPPKKKKKKKKYIYIYIYILPTVFLTIHANIHILHYPDYFPPWLAGEQAH